MMALTSCCPICYKIGPLSKVNCDSLKKRELAQQRFFKFFKRYLNYGNAEEGSNIDKKRKQLHERGYPKLEKLSEVGFLPCQDCLTQMESFCDLYDKLKATELLLNWKVWTVKNIMTGAQRVTSRVKSLREFIEKAEVEERVRGHCWGNGNEIINFITKSRKLLIGKCSRTVENATPKLAIARWQPGGQKLSTTCSMEVAEVRKEVESDYANSNPVIRPPSETEEVATTNIGEKTVESSKLISMRSSPAGTSGDGHDDDNVNHEDSSFISIDHSEPFRNDEVDSHHGLDNMVTEGSSVVANLTSPNVDHFHNTVKVEADAGFIGESIPEPSAASEVHLNTESHESIHHPRPALEPVFDHASNKTDNIIISEDSAQSGSILDAGYPYTGADEVEDSSLVEPEMIIEATPTIRTFDDTQNSETISRLRPTHKCTKCGRTFSNVERIQSHQQEAHGDDADNFSDIESILSEDEHGYADDRNDGSPPFSSSSSSISSSSDDSDNGFEFSEHTEEETPETKPAIKSPIVTATDPWSKIILNAEEDKRHCPGVEGNLSKRKETAKHSLFRLKCPDCNSIFENVKGLLSHRKLSLTCDPSNDPKLKITVDVLVQPSKNEENSSDRGEGDIGLQFSDVFAKIALQQEIFLCDNCDLAVYSKEDMEAHKKLHGTFPCNFCSVTENYAPNLSRHELEHVPTEGKNARTPGKVYCARCNYRANKRQKYIVHHMTMHLRLAAERLQCAICKTSGRWRTNRALATHLKTHHDLTGISDPKDLYTCQEQSCGAYFLLKYQLSNHKKIAHKGSKYLQERRAKNTRKWKTECKTKSRIKYESASPDDTIITEIETEAESKSDPRQQNIQTVELSEPKIAAKLPTNSTTDPSFHTTLEVCNTQKLNSNIEGEKSNQNEQEKYPPFRLRCLDCQALFEDVQGILTHRKFSPTCSPSYDPKVKIAVDVLVPPSKIDNTSIDDGGDDGSIYSVVFAKISLPQEIFLCDKCQLAVYSSEDMEAHNKLHGSFTCQFCDAKVDYAPDLSYHELEHAVTEGKEIKTIGNNPIFYCARCDYGVGNSRERYIIHHLKAHLGLIMNRPKCAICKTNGHSVTNRTLINHFETHHDLTGTCSVKDLCKCPEQNCGAYFLQKLQLNNHMKLRHMESRNVWGRRTQNTGKRKTKCKVALSRNAKESGSNEETKFKDTLTMEMSKLVPRQQTHPSSNLEEEVDLQYNSSSENMEAKHQSLSKPNLNLTKSRTDMDPNVGIEACSKPRTTRNIGRHFRLKCPDCAFLFKDVKSLLGHRRDSQSCSGAYDPNTSIKVKVLVPLQDIKQRETITFRINDKHFTNIFAIIEIPQRMFRCEDCDLELYSSESLEAHKSLHGKFKCNFCQKELAYAKNLAIHELQHSRKAGETSSPVNCPRCDVSYAHEKYDYHYVPHYLTHHMSLSWQHEPLCAICKIIPPTVTKRRIGGHFKNFHDLSELTTSREIVRCPMSACDAYFLTTGQLTGHLRYHHKLGKDERRMDDDAKLKCKDCDKSFVLPHSLHKHRMKHHVPLEKIIPCPFKKCNLVYETRQQLEFHLACSKERHKALDKPKVKEFVNCPVCDKRICSSKSSFLKCHMKSHDTSHVCELCGKQFKTKYSLDNHKLAHSGPESWEFSCSVCGKKCLHKGKLNEHMRTHAKETPYVCEICGQKYAHRHNLRIHVNNKHGDEVQDIPRKINTKNFTSKKGIKRRKIEENDSSDDEDQ